MLDNNNGHKTAFVAVAEPATELLLTSQCDHMGHMNVMWYAGKFEMRNLETNEVAATTILTGVHLDCDRRKSCPFPERILERGRGLIPAQRSAEVLAADRQ